jgi:rSAM/selenodomain-associated transferase 1
MKIGSELMIKKRLIIFTRYPVPGNTKTRMIPALGEQGAADLHSRMTEYTLLNLLILCRDNFLEIEIYYSGGDRSKMQSWLAPVISSFSVNHPNLTINPIAYHAQVGEDLGKRMQGAFEDSFKHKIEKVIIIGTDCPDLSQDLIEDAFLALNSHDVVLGPASDGGYYLIGLSQFFPMLFTQIDWGSDRVLAQTKSITKQEKLSVYDLPVLTDVDRPDDLHIWKSKKFFSTL